MDIKIKANDFFWAKLGGHPPWPCVVVEPGPNVPKRPNMNVHWIYFFGSHTYSWVDENHLKQYTAFRDRYTSLHKTLDFKKAVTEIDNILNEIERDPNYTLSIEPYKPKIKNTLKRNKKSIHGILKRPKCDSNNVKQSESLADYPLLECSNNTINANDIPTSDLTFGVLGVGIIGSQIVKKLIKSGHKVNMWNRTTQKCTEIESQLHIGSNDIKLKTFLSPRAVMQNSDIVLNCVSDGDVSKNIIQNYFGINNPVDKILHQKGFVEVASIDPETSKDIRDMIEMKGGKYLEAQIQGSKTDAEEGKLLILAAGDRYLFNHCQSCFVAIGKSAYFLGDVGYATKINLILQLIKGVCVVGLAEGFALAERFGIPFESLVTKFEQTSLASNYLKRKAAIINKNFNKVDYSLRNMQKDMYLGLQLSNMHKQPMELASLANEMFKHCQKLNLSDKDASSVYLRTRF